MFTYADTVVVPGFTSVNRSAQPDVTGALRAAWLAGARIVGLSTGVFVLAEAGLLDKGPAAVEPQWCDVLRTCVNGLFTTSNPRYR